MLFLYHDKKENCELFGQIQKCCSYVCNNVHVWMLVFLLVFVYIFDVYAVLCVLLYTVQICICTCICVCSSIFGYIFAYDCLCAFVHVLCTCTFLCIYLCTFVLAFVCACFLKRMALFKIFITVLISKEGQASGTTWQRQFIFPMTLRGK